MSTVSSILRTARSHAGLTQRELALRASTAQSVIARIEAGTVNPGIDTLRRLVAATGLELRISAEPPNATTASSISPDPVAGEEEEEPSHMLSDVARILALSPAGRLRELANAANFFAGARRV